MILLCGSLTYSTIYLVSLSSKPRPSYDFSKATEITFLITNFPLDPLNILDPNYTCNELNDLIVADIGLTDEIGSLIHIEYSNTTFDALMMQYFGETYDNGTILEKWSLDVDSSRPLIIPLHRICEYFASIDAYVIEINLAELYALQDTQIFRYVENEADFIVHED